MMLTDVNFHGLASTPPLPLATDSPSSRAMLGEPYQVAGYDEIFIIRNAADPFGGELAESVSQFATANLLEKELSIYPVPTPFAPPPTTSRIAIKVRPINCRPWSWCSAMPQLHFAAIEYMEGYHVTYVTLGIGERQKRYDGSDAVLTLPRTGEQGAWIEYWAVSDHKEGQSPVFRLKYRYVESAGVYRFDLLAPNWAYKAPSGSMLWGLFPPLGRSLPKVLRQPQSADDLHTTNRYAYLAGHLLQSGKVRAPNCPAGGLYESGTATPCGEEASAAAVLEWQNQYDSKIYTAAVKYNIPARVLKGILAQESQFWPHSNDPYELGLGMLTEDGTDMVLTWNVDFYLENCIPMYGKTTCASGYSHLHPVARQMMRKSLIDMVGTDDEIELLAATLHASAAQVNQMVFNTSRLEPSELTDYETMWKISTGNYYAGAGCTCTALDRIVTFGSKLTWEQMVTEMDPVCQTASRYVDRIFSTAFDSNLCKQFNSLAACD